MLKSDVSATRIIRSLWQINRGSVKKTENSAIPLSQQTEDIQSAVADYAGSRMFEADIGYGLEDIRDVVLHDYLAQSYRELSNESSRHGDFGRTWSRFTRSGLPGLRLLQTVCLSCIECL